MLPAPPHTAAAPAAAAPPGEDNTAPRHTRLSSAGGGNLLVAGLLRHTNEDGLRAMFEPYGTVVRAIVMLDPVTAQSRGFGFVLMETSEGAEAARHALHGTMCGPNRLNVRKSFHDGRVVESNAVFVRNIAPSATAESIAARFSKPGPVRAVVFTPAASGAHSGGGGHEAHPVDASALAAYVEYDTIEEARQAIELYHLQPFYDSGATTMMMDGNGKKDVALVPSSSPMLVKFAERYSERKQRQHETAARAPQRLAQSKGPDSQPTRSRTSPSAAPAQTSLIQEQQQQQQQRHPSQHQMEFVNVPQQHNVFTAQQLHHGYAPVPDVTFNSPHHLVATALPLDSTTALALPPPPQQHTTSLSGAVSSTAAAFVLPSAPPFVPHQRPYHHASYHAEPTAPWYSVVGRVPSTQPPPPAPYFPSHTPLHQQHHHHPNVPPTAASELAVLQHLYASMQHQHHVVETSAPSPLLQQWVYHGAPQQLNYQHVAAAAAPAAQPLSSTFPQWPSQQAPMLQPPPPLTAHYYHQHHQHHHQQHPY